MNPYTIMGFLLGGAVIYWFTGASIQAVTTGAGRAVEFIKNNRKVAGLTQEEFAMRSGLGLRFVRELEQGKKTVRMDKVNQALAMFGMEAVPGRTDEK